ncbi:hypothetical protein [Pseudomonas sp. R9.37]|uniref:hypothetical protein n=1 Tax=Pseudomonas sp. R9.37 TaxID=1390498 RepID=UPI000D0E2E27|nr:hypothetical protein [Pseudomonas sp. R9.37]PSL95567.1 hypothetical protein C7U57_07155 [Pseudomonas sp. R9.37]
MKAVDLTPAEIKALEQRRSSLNAIDCSIAEKNKLIHGVKNYKGVDYGMSQYGLYQVTYVVDASFFPTELTGTFTDPRQITRTVDSLIGEGKLVDSE